MCTVLTISVCSIQRRSKSQVALVPRALQKKTPTSTGTSTEKQTTTSTTEKKTDEQEEKPDNEAGQEKKGFGNDYFSKLMQK